MVDTDVLILISTVTLSPEVVDHRVVLELVIFRDSGNQ